MPAHVPHPQGPSSPVRVLSIERGNPAVLVFCGPVEGLLTHWASGQSSACPGETKCPASLHRTRIIWKGYAPVRVWSSKLEEWTAAVLEVTECMEEQLRGQELAGQVWAFTRDPARKRSGQVVGAFVERKIGSALLKPFDILPALYRMYHVGELALGVPNPLPAKIVVEPVAGDGPAVFNAEPPPEPTPITAEQREQLRGLNGHGRRSGVKYN